MADSQSIVDDLHALFAAEREVRRMHDGLVEGTDTKQGRDGLLNAIRDSLIASEGSPEADGAQLVCLARLLGELDGVDAAAALIDVLDKDHQEARHEAGEQLQGLAFDRFKEVALAVEAALERLPRGSSALVELPYILAEISEPGVAKLLVRFLRLADVDAVAAAIEALAEVGDAAAIAPLRELGGDTRLSVLDGDDEGSTEVALGELALAAIEHLQGLSEAGRGGDSE